MQKKLLIRCSAAVAICLFIGFLTSAATAEFLNGWYRQLEKPLFHPPLWGFNLGWALSFALMGISAGIVWSKGFYHKWVKVALYHFGFQLILAAFWPILFFGFQSPLLGLLDLCTLFILLLLTMKWFKIVSDIAAYILFPYLVWILYLMTLNFEIWRSLW